MREWSEAFSAPVSPTSDSPPELKPPAKLKRFHGSVKLDADRTSRDAGQISTEILQHLNSLLGVNVRVTLEIEAEIPGGASEQLIRIVTENCRTLKFDNFEFEEE